MQRLAVFLRTDLPKVIDRLGVSFLSGKVPTTRPFLSNVRCGTEKQDSA